MDNFGAQYGKGRGLQGQSYAIDTMSGLVVLGNEVGLFLRFASLRSDLTFLVTELGTGIAGHKPAQVAPLFRGAPPNVALPESFVEILNDLRLAWQQRFYDLRSRIHGHLEKQLQDDSLFYRPNRLEDDPLWDASNLTATEARLRLLQTEEASGTPMYHEVWRLRTILCEARFPGSPWLHVSESAFELLMRLLFEQDREDELLEEVERGGGIQMGCSAWLEQIAWITESRALWGRGQHEAAIDRLFSALEHSPGPWGPAQPDYLLRGLCDFAFWAPQMVFGHLLTAEIARLALEVAELVRPWRGAWYDATVEDRLSALAANHS